MKACTPLLTRLALSISLFLAGPAYAVSFYTSDTEEPEPRRNEMTVTYGRPDIESLSSLPQVAESLNLEDRYLGGFEKFYFANDPDSDWRVFMDGQWLVRPEQLTLSIEILKPEKFSLNLDYQRWIGYDNPAGIYYPPTDSFFTLSAAALEEEINKLKITLTGTPSDTIEWKIGYRFFNRDGQSLSTRFGDDNQYAVTGTPSRGIVPALVDGEETVHSVDLSLVRDDDENKTGLRLHYQRREVERQRVTERAASQPAANRFTRQEEESGDDIFGFSAFNSKQLSETLRGSIGVAFSRLDGDLTGSRVFGANPEAAYDIDFAASQLNDRGFLDLEGKRRLKQWLVNANLLYQPEGNFRWLGGVRLEHLSTRAFSSYIDTVDVVDWAQQARQNQEADMLSVSEKSALDISAFLDLRYKGFAKSLLYSRIEAATQSGDLEEDWSSQQTVPSAGSPVTLLDRATDFQRDLLLWETGINYYPLTGLRISLEGYLKYRDNEYDLAEVILPDTDFSLYPGHVKEQEFTTRDFNARLHWRIFQGLKSVSRVDFQTTTIDTVASAGFATQSSERERVVFNQSLTWTPHPRFIAVASYTQVDDLTETPVADSGVFSGIVVDLPNDYWQADLNLYYVLSKLIDLQLGYHFLEMSNYLDTSPKTVPYGSDIQQHHALATVILHLRENMAVRFGYQYYEQSDAASADNRDYQVHVLSTSLQAKF